jgi:hypothetical protein
MQPKTPNIEGNHRAGTCSRKANGEGRAISVKRLIMAKKNANPGLLILETKARN